ncbi:MAG: SGNH/GDSL hydrolase family protein [Candidatus Nealsonbacteria bacterium]|nr:SGNH/GDSL hydrolase family protein [Candidatus Nealsonbacteria bacterium]
MSKLKIITIVGDSLSMVRSGKEIFNFYQDTYPFLLQELLWIDNYLVVLRSRIRNNVLTESLKENLEEDVLFNNSRYVVLHLGIVDCAPRAFSLMQERILYVFSQTSVLKYFSRLAWWFQSRYRRFFTKYFPKTYVSEEEFREKFSFIVREIKNKAKPKKVFVINIADTNDKNKLKSFNFEKNILNYNKIIEDLVAGNKDFCELIDLYSQTKNKKEFLWEDGIHLMKGAHDYLAQTLCEKIKKEEQLNQ